MSGNALSPGGRLRAAAGGIRWYLREISGESAYDRYVEHASLDHADAVVVSRREFERGRQDRRDAEPPQRCC